MGAGPWIIEGQPPKKYGCMRAVRTQATKIALRTKADVIVRYLGPKNSDNVEASKSDFKVTPLGHYDFSIDPTWKGR